MNHPCLGMVRLYHFFRNGDDWGMVNMALFYPHLQRWEEVPSHSHSEGTLLPGNLSEKRVPQRKRTGLFLLFSRHLWASIFNPIPIVIYPMAIKYSRWSSFIHSSLLKNNSLYFMVKPYFYGENWCISMESHWSSSIFSTENAKFPCEHWWRPGGCLPHSLSAVFWGKKSKHLKKSNQCVCIYIYM